MHTAPMKAALMILLYLGAVLLPPILSWTLGGPPRALRYEIASGLGILAYSMILLEFVLSGRFKTISNRVGMDVTMRLHQILARTALIFAMLHPFLYDGSLSGGQRPWDRTRQLTLATDFSDLLTGVIAFLLLPALVLFAIARRESDTRYELWRLAHGVAALLIAVLLLHHTTHAGRYGTLPAMTMVWKGMTTIAVGSLLYVYLIEPLRESARKWRVTTVKKLSPKQWELTVAPDGHSGLQFIAGQFAWLNVGHSPFTFHENPFSISSAPSQGPEVSFVIKELGDFTRTLGQIKVDTRAYLDAPYGSLTVEGYDVPGIALIAGGVGIAPMLSILRQMRASDDARQVKLIYGNRAQGQILYRDELGERDITYVLSEPSKEWQGEIGLVDGALLDRILAPDHFRNWLFVLCGPNAMMDAVEAHLITRGTPSDHILSERFDYD